MKSKSDLPLDLRKLNALSGYVGSRAELARRLGVSAFTVNHWMTSKKQIPVKYLRKLVELGDGMFEIHDFIRG